VCLTSPSVCMGWIDPLFLEGTTTKIINTLWKTFSRYHFDLGSVLPIAAMIINTKVTNPGLVMAKELIHTQRIRGYFASDRL